MRPSRAPVRRPPAPNDSSKQLPALFLLVLCTGCLNPFVSYCGEETRSVGSNARFAESDPNSGYFQIDLLERRQDGVDTPREQIGWVLVSDELHGRVTRAAIIDVQSKAVRTTLDVTPGGRPHALAGLARYAGPAPFNDVFRELVNDRLAIRLETSIPGRTTLEQPLRRYVHHDWGRARCD